MKKQIILSLLLCVFSLLSFSQNAPITISGKLDYLKDGDSVILYTLKYGSFYKDQPIRLTYVSKALNHEFYFDIPTRDFSKPQYIALIFPGAHNADNIYYHIVEPGDQIKLSASNGTITFSGRGSEKLTIQQYLDNLFVEYLKRTSLYSELTFHRNLELYDSFCGKAIAYLNSKKGILSLNVLSLLKTDYLASNEYQKVYEFDMEYGYGRRKVDSITMNSYRNAMSKYQNHSFSILAPDCFQNKNILPYSRYYTDYLIEKYTYDSCFSLNKPFVLKNCYNYCKTHYSGLLLERTITALICENLDFAGDLSYCINDALKLVKNKDFTQVLTKLKSTRFKGLTAYNFSLPDSNGQLVNLSEFKGKVVLLDFWFTGCGNCIKAHPYLDSIRKLYIGKDLVIISISDDKEKDMWVNSVRGGKYTSPENINLYTDGQAENHPVIKKYFIDGCPTFVLIDKSGMLMDNPVDPRYDNGNSLISLINYGLAKR